MAKRFRWNPSSIPVTKLPSKLEFDIRDVQRRNPKTENKTPLFLFERGIRKKDKVQPSWWDNLEPRR
jgi:hypothetical protein